MSQDSKSTYIQLSKPFLTSREIEFITKNNLDLSENIRNFNSKTKETFQLLILLIIKLKFPIKVLQNSSYFYQKFFLLNNNYKKYSNLHFEVGLAVLFISLKLNDYIKKLSIVISEGFAIKGSHLSNSEIEENKKIIISLERKILEFQSFDFRNFLIEDFLIKFLKYFNQSNNNNNNIKDIENSTKIEKSFSYLAWSILNDLYLTSLVLQYPAHYNAIISINCSIIIYNELIKNNDILNLNLNSNIKPINWDIRNLLSNNQNDSFINFGCNQLLEYLIDNINITFIKNCLSELKIKIDDKKLIDLLLNIKIDINNKLSSNKINQNLNIINNNDMYFQTRNTEIAKTGSIRFLYNKNKYNDEIIKYLND